VSLASQKNIMFWGINNLPPEIRFRGGKEEFPFNGFKGFKENPCA
jgi:hypothetical protein